MKVVTVVIGVLILLVVCAVAVFFVVSYYAEKTIEEELPGSFRNTHPPRLPRP